MFVSHPGRDCERKLRLPASLTGSIGRSRRQSHCGESVSGWILCAGNFSAEKSRSH